MSTIAQSARAGRAGPRARVRRRPLALGGGVVWIVLFAGLLAGVVAVNVAVLRLNLELDQVGRERSELRTDISRLRSELSVASATSSGQGMDEPWQRATGSRMASPRPPLAGELD